MPYNEEIDDRIKKVIAGWDNTKRKNKFGGVCHLINGHMFCGVYNDFLILRLGVDNAKEALELPYVRPFDITGRPMKGWVMVEGKGFDTGDILKNWLDQAQAFAATLPSK